MYRNFGTWREDRERFPEGIKAVSDYVHSLGMKFGLWIAPEVVGCDNQEMLDYYGDECFIARNGEKVYHGSGYLLDYRHPKVIDYMTATIDRMVTEYGCDYIKFDGCPNPGMGTDVNATGLGDGLEKCMDAFTDWAYEMTRRHPDVIFEDCAGGGLRTDYKALSIFHLISTSDQTSYIHYPYICGNILCSVLPEQAAVWSYPVDTKCYVPGDVAATNANVTEERVVMNMINSLLGRVHLASRLHYLTEEKLALVTEGIALYDRIAEEKKNSLPYLPKGYSMFGDTFVAAGIRTESKVYLAMWNLEGARHVELPLPEINVKLASVAYPATLETRFTCTENILTVDFTEDYQARFFELNI
jgi:alpha-galactosidase